MIKHYGAIFAALMVIAAAAGWAHAQTSTHDFRKTRWGMSPAQVKLTENSVPVGEGAVPPYDLVFTYNGKLFPADVHYSDNSVALFVPRGYPVVFVNVRK